MKTEVKDSVTYQKMMMEVEDILKNVSDPNIDLDMLVHKVERGYALIKEMKSRLDVTKKKIESLRSDFETN